MATALDLEEIEAVNLPPIRVHAGDPLQDLKTVEWRETVRLSVSFSKDCFCHVVVLPSSPNAG